MFKGRHLLSLYYFINMVWWCLYVCCIYNDLSTNSWILARFDLFFAIYKVTFSQSVSHLGAYFCRKLTQISLYRDRNVLMTVAFQQTSQDTKIIIHNTKWLNGKSIWLKLKYLPFMFSWCVKRQHMHWTDLHYVCWKSLHNVQRCQTKASLQM